MPVGTDIKNTTARKQGHRRNRLSQLCLYIRKSEFVRSIFIRTIVAFLTIILLVVTIIYFSFNTEINRSVIEGRKKQLMDTERLLSDRMSEVISIAYAIGNDSTFLLEPVNTEKSVGYRMADRLSTYLVGNDLMKLLAFYRLSEPDVIYTSNGELSFHSFFDIYIKNDHYRESDYLQSITRCKGLSLLPESSNDSSKAYFTFVCPLPQFSSDPQAFMLALIPLREFESAISSQLAGCYGKVALFDLDGRLIYEMSTMDEEYALQPSKASTYSESTVRISGDRYILQSQVSVVNGWSCVSLIRLGDMMSGLTGFQIGTIIAVTLLMMIAVMFLLVGIVNKYKPISQLALTLTDDSHHSKNGGTIDERSLLAATIASLKLDSEQKQLLEVAYQEATEANIAKSRFLSNMSHDIRTPMNAILGMTGLATKHINDTAFVEDCLKNVGVASHYLLDIINNVLDMSRIESGKLTLSEEVIDLSVLIKSIRTIVSTNVDQKGQNLIIEVGDLRHHMIIGDAVRLTQICMNILSNAVKFTPVGGSITMHVQENEDASFTFTFTDTGIGMPEEFVAQVFDAFSRAQESGISGVEGTGLGMSIAKNLTELMGGTIRCRSIEGQGTTFVVHLPLKLAPDDAQPEPHRTASAQPVSNDVDLTGHRILLVEDNKLNREIAKRLLFDTKAEVIEAVNGKEAVEIFHAHEEGFFDIILMDLRMPIMNGYEATVEIRSSNRGDSDIPIYAVTADTFDEDIQRINEVGMNGHLKKPYSIDELYRLLRENVKEG